MSALNPLLTFVNVRTREMIQRPESVGATTLVASIRVVALVRAAVRNLNALVNILASAIVVRQPIARFARTSMRPDHVQTDIRTIPVVLDAFVNVAARPVVTVQLKPVRAIASMAANKVVTLPLTTPVLRRTLVNVQATGGVLQPETGRAGAHYGLVTELTHVRATSVVEVTLVVDRTAPLVVG